MKNLKTLVALREKKRDSHNLKNKERLKSQTLEIRESKGITLIALVVTIVVLLILAGITITALFGENGLIERAKIADQKTKEGAQNDISAIEDLGSQLNSIVNGPTIESLTKKAATKNEIVYDKYVNKITVPKGFKIVTPAEDSTVVYAYDKESGVSTNTPVVQDGIVIQDSVGNQFVWIPVGEIKNDAVENTTNKTPIILGRYTFDIGDWDDTTETYDGTGEETLVQAAYTDENATNYTNKVTISSYYQEDSTPREGLVDTSNSLNDLNATAKDLASFVNSVKTKGGYYIARYEASYGSGYNSDGATDDLKYANAKPLSKPSTANSEDSMDYTPGTLWNYITQLNAAKVARNMYAGNKDINNNEVGVESDLINSYAWDTAIVFIQKYSNNTAYSKQKSKNTDNLANTGERTGTTDKVCNIYDMASNTYEWTTEYSTYTYYSSNGYPCVRRGGNYTYSRVFAATRSYFSAPYGKRQLRLFPPHTLHKVALSPVGNRPEEEMQ